MVWVLLFQHAFEPDLQQLDGDQPGHRDEPVRDGIERSFLGRRRGPKIGSAI